jgi:hypothetical protein
MKLRNIALLALAISSLLITSTALAMVGGTEQPAITEAFQNALKTGTKEAVTQCIQDHAIAFNKRCIPYQLTPRGTEFIWAYPLEYVIKYYVISSEGSFRSSMQLLLDLGAPMNEYEDYSPLIHKAGAAAWEQHLPILLKLGADPNKKILHNKHPTTPLEWAQNLMQNGIDKAKYTKIHDLFLHPPAVEKNMPQAPASTSSAPARPVSATFLKLMAEATAGPADAAPEKAKNHNNIVYTRQQVAVIAGIAFLVGVLCTKLFEWQVNRTEATSTQSEDHDQGNGLVAEKIVS